MKIADFKPIDNTILLGIFDTSTFQYFKKQKNVDSYAVFSGWTDAMRIIDIVEFACNRANMIIFVLDDVRFPIDIRSSHTCAELELICKNDTFFNKTVFVKGENVIDFDKNLVLN